MIIHCPVLNNLNPFIIKGIITMIPGFTMIYFENIGINKLKNIKMCNFINDGYYYGIANTMLSMGAIMIGYGINKAIK